MTVESGLVSRAEFFDEADLDAALAKFEQLSRPTPRLENAASQVAERFREHFAAGSWNAMAARVADDFSTDDRRRLVGAAVRTGREAQIMNMRAIAGLYNAEYDVHGHRSPWGASCPFALRLFGTRSKARCFSHRYALHHRDRR